RQQREVDHREEEDGVAAFVLQRVEDGAVPQVHAVGSRDVEEDDEQQAAGQAPGDGATALAPEAACGLPAAPQPIAAPQGLRILARVLLGDVRRKRGGRRSSFVAVGLSPAHLFTPSTRRYSMTPKKPTPDPGSNPGQTLIRGGNRWSKIMLQQQAKAG